MATLGYYYQGGTGPYAFKAEAERQVMSSSGTMVTVGSPTTLDLNIQKDASSFMHYVSGTLWSGSSGLAYKTIKIYVNDTLESTVTTIPGMEGEGTGDFGKSLSLQPLNNQPTLYRITVSYEGSFQGNATASTLSPNSTSYAVSTTIQYGYKPVSNMKLLVVSPESTQATTPTKTPEQLQQEAEQSGGLSIWHEFTWQYPWYRLHVKFNMNGAKIDLGFNSALLGGGTAQVENLGNIVVPVTSDPTIPIEELKRLVQEMFESSIVDALVLGAAALAAGNTTFPH